MELELFNPNISVKDVKKKLLHDNDSSKKSDNENCRMRQADTVFQILIREADDKMKIRAIWPKGSRWRKFPFNLKIIKRISLKLYELILRDVRFSVSKTLQSMQQLREIIDIQKEMNIVHVNKINQLELDIAMLKHQLFEKVDSYENETSSKKTIDESGNLLGVNTSIANQIPAESTSKFFDNLYASFENKFRGTCEEIKIRQSVYLPFVKEIVSADETHTILDVGCGRGEWLGLLEEQGFKVKGIDINSVFIDICQEQGFDVSRQSMQEYLSNIESNSVDLVTGFHIIEHLSFEDMVYFFRQTLRILKPDGLAIYETPNPENILVSSYNFYLDPTHRNPLPSIAIKFILENLGFKKCNILNLQPLPEEVKFPPSELSDRLNAIFYSERDYGVLAYK